MRHVDDCRTSFREKERKSVPSREAVLGRFFAQPLAYSPRAWLVIFIQMFEHHDLRPVDRQIWLATGQACMPRERRVSGRVDESRCR